MTSATMLSLSSELLLGHQSQGDDMTFGRTLERFPAHGTIACIPIVRFLARDQSLRQTLVAEDVA